MNQPPEHCSYCSTAVTGVDTPTHAVVETPTVYRYESCGEYVFYNPTPGGSVAVVGPAVEDGGDPRGGVGCDGPPVLHPGRVRGLAVLHQGDSRGSVRDGQSGLVAA